MKVLSFLSRTFRIRANKRLKGLLRALQYGTTDAKAHLNTAFVRGRAAVTLGLMGDSRAVEPLMQALGDADRWVRSAAAWALGRLGDARAVNTLVEALDDEDWMVRSEAHKALIRIKADGD